MDRQWRPGRGGLAEAGRQPIDTGDLESRGGEGSLVAIRAPENPYRAARKLRACIKVIILSGHP